MQIQETVIGAKSKPRLEKVCCGSCQEPEQEIRYPAREPAATREAAARSSGAFGWLYLLTVALLAALAVILAIARPLAGA